MPFYQKNEIEVEWRTLRKIDTSVDKQWHFIKRSSEVLQEKFSSQVKYETEYWGSSLEYRVVNKRIWVKRINLRLCEVTSDRLVFLTFILNSTDIDRQYHIPTIYRSRVRSSRIRHNGPHNFSTECP